MARLTLRLSGTEKQRDDALEALVLQQEIAEDLERERKRNQKELSKVQLRVDSVSQQRDEAHRVVLHLRSLISGQSHHMEHVLRTIGSANEISDFLGFDESEEGEETGSDVPSRNESMAPDFEDHLLGLGKAQKRLARLSITDVADRYLRDKTDAIADIVRNISEQCAAAVEGLQLAQHAEDDEDTERVKNQHSDTQTLRPGLSNRDESTEGNSRHPEHRSSSIPPTPDLVHNRSSTSMSMVSSSTFQDRTSQQYNSAEVPTRIVESDHEPSQDDETLDGGSETATATLSKHGSEDLIRPTSARVVS